MKRVRSYTSQELLTKKTETLKVKTRMGKSTNNGILYTLMSGRENQLRDN